jgi:hypothetical protein
MVWTQYFFLLQHWRFICYNKYNTSVPLQETTLNKVCVGDRRHSRHAHTRIMDFPAIGCTQVGRSWPSSQLGGGTCAQQWYNRTSPFATVSTQQSCQESNIREHSIHSRGLAYCSLPSLWHQAGTWCKYLICPLGLVLVHREGSPFWMQQLGDYK